MALLLVDLHGKRQNSLPIKCDRPLLARDAVIYVRTDARKFTYDSTIEALEHAFPRKSIRDEKRSRPKFSQTALFTSKVKSKGEVDLLMW